MTSFPISIAVTGHRSLPVEKLPHIVQQVRDVLDVLRREALSITKETPYFFTPQPVLQVISCLSEGADRLVAQEALAKGYALGGILPFPRHSSTHARDLPPDQQRTSRAELHHLLEAAESVLELAPDYVGEEQGQSLLATAQRQQAYTEAGLRMLEHSDILLAIWHGAPQPAPGSTASMVDHALQRHMPVVWIHTCENPPHALHSAKKWDTHCATAEISCGGILGAVSAAQPESAGYHQCSGAALAGLRRGSDPAPPAASFLVCMVAAFF